MRSRLPAIIPAALVLFAAALAAAGFNPREYARHHGGTARLSIATGNTGGVYYPYGGGLAKGIRPFISHLDGTPEGTNPSVNKLKFIQEGKVDISFFLPDTLDDSLKGK